LAGFGIEKAREEAVDGVNYGPRLDGIGIGAAVLEALTVRQPDDCHEHEPGNAEQDRIPPFARSM
jgi:hypothetical protein